MLLIQLLKALKLEEIAGDGRDTDARRLWVKYFNVNIVETRNRRFDERIVTDGCAVSVLIAKKSQVVCPTKEITQRDLYGAFEWEKNVVVTGVDPGFMDVVTTRSFEQGDEVEKSESYSSARYYEKAKVNLSRRRTTKWNAETLDDVMSIPSPMTADATAMDQHVSAYLATLRSLVVHRHSKGYRNMRFLRCIYKKAAINEICDLIAPPGKFCIIGFGDWKGGHKSPIRRRTCGPIEEIKLELQARSNVMFVLVPEYKTSVTCSCCGGRLVNMVAKTTNRQTHEIRDKKSKVHKILHCKSRTCSHEDDYHGTTWNRDVNASRNILELTMCMVKGYPRPMRFSRDGW